ncbi:SDR family NAD(P)-dependent oxidoreductase [Ancylobacter defluvii]|uniref:Ketoreductase n=1 Tax=Ancylobacter defluvii TaxID=1282440 RepID=A0A9W6NA17_9HYPH|nr:SDR family oxidoreductase [Ancylobacter defluvii]MBS7589969.1 SDR family oxidoreductase [Ancylobacter defluvii]GLK83097.1 ketoreductase [Ancylobacter defluvii]
MTTFEGRVAIVTGGGAGIGQAAARQLADKGAYVLITGRRPEAVAAAAAAHPSIEGFVADAARPEAIEATVREVLRRWGRLDIVVNNAGAGQPAALEEVSAESLQAIFSTNVFGPTLLAKAALPELRKAGGAIVNLSSTLARKPVPGFSAYSASKAALEQLTRSWALELAAQGVRVNAVASGPVESDFLRERMGFSDDEITAIKTKEVEMIPLGRRGVPDDVARWVVALADPAADWVTGQIIGVDGGFGL